MLGQFDPSGYINVTLDGYCRIGAARYESASEQRGGNEWVMARTARERGARPTASQSMWPRLLAGEFTEVFVFGRWPGLTLPYTLGLEPILSKAYRYNADGTLRSRDDLAQAAWDLSAGKRWIATGLEPEWASAFMDRAQVIVFYDTLWTRAMRPNHPAKSRGKPIPPLPRYAWYRVAQAQTRSRTPIGVYRALPEPPWSRWDGDEVSVLEKLASSRYRDKLVHLTSREQIRPLRRVRPSTTQ